MNTPVVTLNGHCASAPGAKADQYHNGCPHVWTSAMGVPHICSCEKHKEEVDE